VLSDGASAFLPDFINRVHPARWTIRLVLDVGIFTEQIRVSRCGGKWLMILCGPGNFCAVNLFAVEGACTLLSGRNTLLIRRDRNGSQNPDNSDDDHDFNEGESSSGLFHISSFRFRPFSGQVCLNLVLRFAIGYGYWQLAVGNRLFRTEIDSRAKANKTVDQPTTTYT
jgi:hypothetical protein